MKILITTGFSGKDVGGPAQYGPRLMDAFIEQGHEVRMMAYGFEKKLPIGVRHICFFFKIIPKVIWAEKIIALDTFSVGVPSVMAAKLFGIKIIIRIGGDFLWEAYTHRTSEKITLTQFNTLIPNINLKEKIILSLTKYLTRNADVLSFNSAWQKKIWEKSYNIDPKRTTTIRNYIPAKEVGEESEPKTIVWAGRDTPLKNVAMLKSVVERVKLTHNDVRLELIMNEPRQSVLDKMKKAYVVVLPSVSDVSPNVILEGASYGKPFIVTKETSIGEILPRGGIFIDPLDEHDFERAVLEMLNPESYRKYKEEINKEYKPRSWKEVSTEFLNA